MATGKKRSWTMVSFGIPPDIVDLLDGLRDDIKHRTGRRPSRDEIAKQVFILGIECLRRGESLPGDPAATLQAAARALAEKTNQCTNQKQEITFRTLLEAARTILPIE